MASTLVECVPNFSEGRDLAKVDAIVEAIASAGASILHRTSDPDHNRSVVTFVAQAETVGEAALRGVRKAVELIDLRIHTGVHPRIGAADVVPFVPLRGISMEECAALATEVGGRIWKELRVPVYLYEASARRPQCVSLPDVRRGQFEGLQAEARTNPERCPDFGGPELHPSAGASVVGARKLLVAFNALLDTTDLQIAQEIARAVRGSTGGLASLRAIGVYLASRGQAQVSMNLTDFERTGMHVALEAVRTEASKRGASVTSTELIGLAPAKALEAAAAAYLRIEGFELGRVLENRLEDYGPTGRR
ncbi:MAG: glutamate formimidoyltransferase [Bryobacteraceae bacterium]